MQHKDDALAPRWKEIEFCEIISLILAVKRTLAAILFLFSLLALAEQPPDQAWFRSDTLELRGGGSAKLMWHWTAATSGFLSGRGVLENPKDGSFSVSPSESTEYVLILEARNAPTQVLSARVLVRGAKGSAGEWPTDPFTPFPFEANYDVTESLAVLAAKTDKILQDTLQFQVRRFAAADGQVVFYTAFQQQKALLGEEDRGKKVRRIAYRVALSTKGIHNPIHVNLSASIDWRPVIDKRWLVENSSSSAGALYRRQIESLKTAILGN